MNIHSEPSVSANRLASKPQYEVAEEIAAERQTYVHEEHVVAMFTVSIFYRSPDGHYVGMVRRETFPTECRVPQVGVVVAEYHSRTTDYMRVDLGNKHFPFSRLREVGEELLVGNISLRLHYVMTFQQFYECAEVVGRCNYVCGYSSRFGMTYALEHFQRKTFFGSMAVKGVVDAHPVDWEIA